MPLRAGDQGSCEAEGVLKLLAFVLPLGLDSFAVAAAIGASQAAAVAQRLRISLIFVLFEGGMPLIGLALGAVLARGIGQVADYVAGAAVVAIGAWLLLASYEDEEEKASRLTASHGLALIGLGISITPVCCPAACLAPGAQRRSLTSAHPGSSRAGPSCGQRIRRAPGSRTSPGRASHNRSGADLIA
jgi:hypothetical protein